MVIGIHGSFHLIGFVKAFNFADMSRLTRSIPKTSGILWLAASVIFMTTFALIVSKNDLWWIVGIAAVLLSQIMIVQNWHDAKFGTIANVIVLIASIIGYGAWSYYGKYKNDVKTVLRQNTYPENSVLTETDIQQLPEKVKNYLRYTGAIGKPKVNNFKIEFTGKIRRDEQSEWMPFTCEQYNFTAAPARLFFMKAAMNGLPVGGYHCFKNGVAFMDIRLFSLFKVQYQVGAEMNLSETVTFFNDMCVLAPSTLIDKRIKWLEVGNNKVKVSFTNNSITVFAWLYFNDKNELINFISGDRFAGDTGKQFPWATPLKDYKETNGYKLMGNAEVIYSYPDRDLCYGTFKLTNVKYNVKEFK
jgi:hypothetical protein